MSEPLLIWGVGGHARVVADVVRLVGRHHVAAFLDDYNPVPEGATCAGVPVYGDPAVLDQLRRDGVSHAVVAVGNCAARLRLADRLVAGGFALATAVHPRAVVAGDVPVGPGTVVAGGAVVNPGAKLGANVIVNTGAVIDHDCVLEDGAHVCPGACLAGTVTVGRAAWVGVGATVKENVTIGAGALVGAGAVVLHDVPPGVVAFGVPAAVRPPRAA